MLARFATRPVRFPDASGLLRITWQLNTGTGLQSLVEINGREF